MLSKGDIFPSQADRQRMALEQSYDAFLNNLSNQNSEYKANYQGTIKQVKKNPVVPIAATVAEISGDLLFGEFPEIDLQSEKAQPLANDWIYDTNIKSKFLEMATYTSAIGTVYALFFKQDDDIQFKFYPSYQVISSELFNNITDVKFIINSTLEDNGVYVVFEILEYTLENDVLTISHYNAKVMLSNWKVKDIEILDDEVKPEIDYMPVVKNINMGVMGSEYGKSDYSGKEQLFAEIDNRVDQINNVLEENADPWKAIPSGILNKSGEFNRAAYNLKMFEKTATGVTGENSVDIMTWDASLESAFKQIETMVKLVFFTSRLSDPITGLDKGGNVESGRALKWKSINTMSMITRKRIYSGQFIRNFFDVWGKLSGNEIDAKAILIKWQDGLPLDEEALTDTVVARVNSGLMSRLTGIKTLDESSVEEAQKELDQVVAEETQKQEIEGQNLAPLTI